MAESSKASQKLKQQKSSSIYKSNKKQAIRSKMLVEKQQKVG